MGNEWASDEKVRNALREAGIEPDDPDARGAVSPHGRLLDEVARDAVIAECEAKYGPLPAFNDEADDRAEEMLIAWVIKVEDEESLAREADRAGGRLRNETGR